MLPQLRDALRKAGFQGELETAIDSRVATAGDNSIYELLPDAVAYPKNINDISKIVEVVYQGFPTLRITPRGGATGTNGQSLNRGLIVDTSRHLDRVIALDAETMMVKVEPGITLDGLNRFLADYGLFFPPDVSSGSRATIGGMVATDASGRGSRLWGKTSDWIERLDLVLADGRRMTVGPTRIEALGGNDRDSRLLKRLYQLLDSHRDAIDSRFPKMNRGLTGYNLQQAIGRDGWFDPQYLLAGSEGTLALVAAVTLRVIPRHHHHALVVVAHDDFNGTLKQMPELLTADPAAVEVLDDHLLDQAHRAGLLRDETIPPQAQGVAYVELVADDEETLAARIERVNAVVTPHRARFGVVAVTVASEPDEITALLEIRRRAVGLLGAIQVDGDRRPLAFVEDTAVPPEKLGDYIGEFRALLDHYGLRYGMYGHADVGCLHLRPALDMKLPTDRALIRAISDEVATLVQRYGGVFWGEHGKGFRGEYAPAFFGPELMPLLRQVKALFDPDNRFNPGKLATPDGSPVIALDAVPFRGEADAAIPPPLAQAYAPAIACNGNALCQNFSPTMALCPSYKALRDKRHSPKGRAAMLRHWLREPTPALETALADSLSQCLSCGSCGNDCPLGVDIPEMKSRFLDTHHRHHSRPLRDHLFALLEPVGAVGRRLPRLTNALLHNRLGRAALHRAGLCDLPRFQPMQQRPARDGDVVLLPDSFNASFDGAVIDATARLLTELGYRVAVAPVLANGKALHVKGFRRRFEQVARRHRAAVARLAANGRPLLALDTATRRLHDHEYATILGEPPPYRVQSLEAWLAEEIDAGRCATRPLQSETTAFRLFPHCQEQSGEPDSMASWQRIYAAFGLTLTVERAGCCGMSGLFGHETANAELSRRIFAQNWQHRLREEETVLVSGFSCRAQLRRHGYRHLLHPATLLLLLLLGQPRD